MLKSTFESDLYLNIDFLMEINERFEDESFINPIRDNLEAIILKKEDFKKEKSAFHILAILCVSRIIPIKVIMKHFVSLISKYKQEELLIITDFIQHYSYDVFLIKPKSIAQDIPMSLIGIPKIKITKILEVITAIFREQLDLVNIRNNN